MLELKAKPFVEAAASIAWLHNYLIRPDENIRITHALIATIKSELSKLEGHCKQLELQHVMDHIDRIKSKLDRDIFHPSIAEVKRDLMELENRFTDALKNAWFLYLTPKERDLYLEINPFGEGVPVAFPSTRTHIEEASKCLAFHRNSACVYHLMLALEVGVKSLAKRLGVEYIPIDTWGTILNRCLDEVDKRTRQKRNLKPKAWLTEEQFYNEVATFLHRVKTAWRDPGMHIGRTYTDEHAQDVFASSSAFMRKLAERVKEPKRL